MAPPLGRRNLIQPSPAALLDFYGAKFRNELMLQFAYRGALVIWLFGLVLQPLVSLVVWTTVAESRGGSAGGFTAPEYAGYFIAVMVVNQLTFTWIAWTYEWRVRTGVFSAFLLRPMHPIHNDLVENLSFKAMTFVVLLPIAVVLSIGFDAALRPSPGQALAFLPALLLAMGLRFFVEWTVAMAAFWFTRLDAILRVFGSLSLFLTGMVAPLSLFPEPVQVIAGVLPFRWMVAFPVELLLGRLSVAEIALGLLMQMLWIALALALLTVVWRHAIRRYSVVGA